MNSLSTALVNIRRGPYQALASILLISVTFFMAYMFSFLLLGADKVLRYFESSPQIIGFFEISTPQEQIQTIENQIKLKPYVTDVKIVSKEQALEIYKKENQENPLLVELVTADILPASIEVSANSINDLAQINNDLKAAEGIDEVVYQEEILQSLSRWTNTLRTVGVGLIAIMGTISFLTITVITMMKAASKKGTITIMRLVGATKWYIRAPFVVEGMLYGFFGSVIGWSITFIALLYLTPHITSFLGEIPVFPIPVTFYLIQLTIGTLIGMLLGGSAASVAAGRFIKR